MFFDTCNQSDSFMQAVTKYLHRITTNLSLLLQAAESTADPLSGTLYKHTSVLGSWIMSRVLKTYHFSCYLFFPSYSTESAEGQKKVNVLLSSVFGL
jgi:hypothetical protein